MDGENKVPIHFSSTSCCKSANLKKNQIVENNMNLNFLLFINEHTTERKPHMSKTKILIETEKDEYQNTAKAKLNLLPGW